MDWTRELPPEGTWCWVYAGQSEDPVTHEKTDNVFLAMRSRMAAGGWTNEDCWEDFDEQVQCWIPIEKPDPPSR